MTTVYSTETSRINIRCEQRINCDCFTFHLELKVANFLLQVQIIGGQVGILSVGLFELAAQLGYLILLSSQRRSLTLRQLKSVQ